MLSQLSGQVQSGIQTTTSPPLCSWLGEAQMMIKIMTLMIVVVGIIAVIFSYGCLKLCGFHIVYGDKSMHLRTLKKKSLDVEVDENRYL